MWCRRLALAARVLAGLAAAAGCGDDSASEPGVQAKPCGDVCDRVESLCGSRPAGCESGCAQLTAAERDCVLGAQTCKDANACSAPEPADAAVPEDGLTPDAGPRCSNGYLLGTSSCTSLSTVEGCAATPYGTPVTTQLRCEGATPSCLQSGQETESIDDDQAGCCPAGSTAYDPSACVSQ